MFSAATFTLYASGLFACFVASTIKVLLDYREPVVECAVWLEEPFTLESNTGSGNPVRISSIIVRYW